VPAAAVIPALIAYIKVVAVKKLVVGFWNRFFYKDFGLASLFRKGKKGEYWSSCFRFLNSLLDSRLYSLLS